AKHLATLGLDKGHINGKIMGSNSTLKVACPVEFVVKTVEGTSASEYQLLRLYKKGNRREFRAMTGGIIHAKGGAERTDIPFTPEKVGNRAWRIRLSGLSSGEYGLLPPGVSAASISASGKMYTFEVTEDGMQAASTVHGDDSTRPVSRDANPVAAFSESSIG